MRDTLRILHLEDDRLHSDIARALLAEDGIVCVIERVATEEEYVAALESGQIDLVLADFTLPGFDGLQALSLVRERFPDLPFIFVTGTMGEEIAITSLKRGATDYILKNRLSRLAPAVRRALVEADERMERKNAEAALRRSEEELRKSNEMFRALIQSSPLAIFLLNEDGTVKFWNPAAERIFGRSEAEVQGRLLPTVPEERLEVFSHICKRILQGETVVCNKLQWQHKDGSLIDISLHAAPVCDATGKAVSILSMAADITESKRVEREQ